MTIEIGLMKLASALATHANKRQSLIAENMANADTPGYQARDLESFSSAIAQSGSSPKAMRATRAEHFGYSDGDAQFAVVKTAAFGAETPNGNTVSLDDQMMRSAALQVDHDLALGVYKKSLQILRLSLGRRS